MSATIRPNTPPREANNRALGQKGLVHPRHVHPRNRRLTGTPLKDAVRRHEALVLERGRALELQQMEANPRPLPWAAMKRLWAKMFPPGITVR